MCTFSVEISHNFFPRFQAAHMEKTDFSAYRFYTVLQAYELFSMITL